MVWFLLNFLQNIRGYGYYIIHLLCRIIRHCIVLCYVSTHIKATVHCLLVQDRMEAASTSVYMFDGAVRGQHVCKNVWTPLTDKMCKCIMHEGSSKRDKSAVNIQL